MDTTGGLIVGSKAPDFELESDDGSAIRLSGLRGKAVVIYFYPKDNTPGCIAEACSFRDIHEEMRRAGAVVLGVSKDSPRSHQGFKLKHNLNFPLLSDPQGEVIGMYGAWKEKTMFGKTSMGTERCTYLVDKEGLVRRIWRNVKVKEHAEDVLEAVREMAGE